MTTKTRSDLINQALANLGVIAAGQDPEAEDNEAVDKYVDPLLAELAARDLPQVDDADAIPYEWFLPLAILLAAEAATEFGLSGLPTSTANPDPIGSAERRLREVAYARPTGVPQRTEYF